jgi:hypothetical protein|tara:strand:+ start:165 stop:425 length:261 start_codon:yes stop_codon:yes gene_type:complete
MSVYSGRKTRQLYDPESAMYHFQKTEGKAMPSKQPNILSTILTLFLIMIATSSTTIAIYNREEMFMYIGFASILIIGIIYFCRICT